MILYRGGFGKERKPKPDEYPGVFFATTKGGASNYGPVVSAYETIGTLNILARESEKTPQLIAESDPEYWAEEEMTQRDITNFFVTPTEDWVAFLIERGYDGLSYETSDGGDVFLFDPKRVRSVK